ncbi:hypothetical protein L2E82_45213 [Cichorium intybus]|uniref:Uncharacterized protein n=1 Tax=Cichorium intybus TaxID=13427 RepID=A0ACB8ZTQ4_CICIN|nr:hypothetical protein L2E82_45213 [Cichorium intybus]
MYSDSLLQEQRPEPLLRRMKGCSRRRRWRRRKGRRRLGIGGRRNRHQKEPNDRKIPFAHNVDDLSHNDDGVVETVAATVNVPIVSQEANRRGGAGRYQVKPKSKPSSDQKVVCEPNELSRSDAGGHGVVKAVVAAVTPLGNRHKCLQWLDN